jgi:hypothetical protein
MLNFFFTERGDLQAAGERASSDGFPQRSEPGRDHQRVEALRHHGRHDEDWSLRLRENRFKVNLFKKISSINKMLQNINET